MKVSQLVKQLNNTELGKGGTHDTYVLIPNELNIKDIFATAGAEVEFTDLITKEKIIVRNTESREKRIVGLGQYYRDKDLSAGDEIIFERITCNVTDTFLINTKKRENSLVFQKMKYGFEILTPEKMSLFMNISKQMPDSFKMDFIESARKRNDSPETTDFYDIAVNGKSLLDSYGGKEIGIVQIEGNKIEIGDFYGWKKYMFETEE